MIYNHHKVVLKTKALKSPNAPRRLSVSWCYPDHVYT